MFSVSKTSGNIRHGENFTSRIQQVEGQQRWWCRLYPKLRGTELLFLVGVTILNSWTLVNWMGSWKGPENTGQNVIFTGVKWCFETLTISFKIQCNLFGVEWIIHENVVKCKFWLYIWQGIFWHRGVSMNRYFLMLYYKIANFLKLNYKLIHYN